MNSPTINLTFPHRWQARILPARPLILPQRNFVYPAQAEEVERGALEILITFEPSHSQEKHSPSAQEFLATCALGFADPIVPSGLWSCPKPEEICAVAGGYAYLINTVEPEQFTFLALRPVLSIHVAVAAQRLIFVGHRGILAWGPDGLAWDAGKLSDEGITVARIDDTTLHGLGWEMMTDQETPFVLDLATGQRCE
ncbi:MAG TPA: hypothetical protein VF392_14655 [Terracidiphilus sp.]